MNGENAWATGRSEQRNRPDYRPQPVKISVVLPVKNGGIYVREAINSILKQTFSDLELLVIDDGSTDDTSEIVKKCQEGDPRVRVLNNPGTGLVDALNFGVRSARAPLIARMDADDIALPERLQRQYGFLAAHPDIDLVGSQVAFIDENGALTGKTTALPENPKAVAKTLLKFCCIRHPTVLMRRTPFERVGGYRAQVPAAEDLDLWLRMAEQGRLANMPDALLQYRLHAAQVSQAKIWTQRLSRNLAIISAQERRAERSDPLDDYMCFKREYGQHECKGLCCHKAICESIKVFSVASGLLQTAPNAVTREDARSLVRYVTLYAIGDGKTNRVRVLVALVRNPVLRRGPLLLLRAFATALLIHPGRTLRLLLNQRG